MHPIWFCIFLIFISFIMSKVRSCRDVFYIQKEFKLTLIWMISMAIAYILIVIPLIGIDTNLRILLDNIWMAMGLYILCLVPTLWVIRQYEKQNMALPNNMK